MITNTQIRAGRVYLDWSQDDLAKAAQISVSTVRNIEGGITQPQRAVLQKIKKTFEDAGIEFGDRESVRRKSENVTFLEGKEGIEHFFETVYLTAKNDPREILVSGVDEQDFVNIRSKENSDRYRRKMEKIKNLQFKVVVRDSDPNPVATTYITYRSIPDDYFSSVPFYVLGDRLAIILWKSLRIIILNDPEIADAYRKQFKVLWEIR